jgi:hypothetical protein
MIQIATGVRVNVTEEEKALVAYISKHKTVSHELLNESQRKAARDLISKNVIGRRNLRGVVWYELRSNIC